MARIILTADRALFTDYHGFDLPNHRKRTECQKLGRLKSAKIGFQ